jgi:hypothetical protein
MQFNVDCFRRFLRSSRIDSIIVWGWVAILLAGQCLLNIECNSFEWLAALCLWVGMLLVRPSMCLPLVILACPAFMCENRRAWAWVQPVMLWIFFFRVLIENKFTLRQYLTICLAATAVLFLSWPDNAGYLLYRSAQYERCNLFGYWIGPHAVWSIFPFRQCVDRALLAALAAGLLVSKRYFNSRKIWNALWISACMLACATLLINILPWQELHRFLGTTNAGKYGGRLFHGTGFNVTYTVFVMLLGIPWYFIGLGKSLNTYKWCWIPTLIPLIALTQKAFLLGVISFILLATVFAVGFCLRKTCRPTRRLHSSPRGCVWIKIAIVSVALSLSAAWFFNNDILDQSSLLRRVIERHLVGLSLCSPSPKSHSMKEERTRKASKSKVVRSKKTAEGSSAKKEASPAQYGPHSSLATRLKRMDPVRWHMWKLAVNKSRKDYIFKGAGAGKWAMYHKTQPRPYRPYYAHLHNTYLDLMFEYGVLPMLLFYLLWAIAVFKIAVFGVANRLWLYYFAAIAMMALGQHLLYAFTSMVLLLPALVVIPRALVAPIRKKRID